MAEDFLAEEAGFPITEIESTFGVITSDSDPCLVTEALGLEPTRSRKEGDETYSKFSSRTFVARHGIWALEKKTVGREIGLSEHLTFYKELLSHKFEAIERLKSNQDFECVFYVLATEEDTVGGFELSAEDMSFIGKIADRFTYRICTNLGRDEMESRLRTKVRNGTNR